MRTGREGGRYMEGEGRRKSRNVIVNKKGRKLCRFLGEMGCAILNGDMKGDERGEWTHVGWRGGSAIDYVIGDEEMREKVDKMVVEDRVDSNHQPVSVLLRGKRERRKSRKAGPKRRGESEVEEGKRKFGVDEIGEKEVEEEWGRLKVKIEEALGNMEKRVVGGGKKEWWDEECRESKEKVRRELRKWRREGGEGESYRRERGRYKKLYEGKREREREEWEREVGRARTEGQVWKIVNKERRKRKRINESIDIEEWDSYFKKLLGGVEGGIGAERERERGDDGEEEINRKELKLIVRRMKDRKATKEDGIPNEVWKYGGRSWRVVYGGYVIGYGKERGDRRGGRKG